MVYQIKFSWLFYLILVSSMSFCTKNKALDDLKEPYDSQWEKVITINEEVDFYDILPIGKNELLFTSYWDSFLTDTSFKIVIKKHGVAELNTASYSNIKSDKVSFFIVKSYLYATNSTTGINLNEKYGSGKFWINNTAKQLLMSLDVSPNFEIADLSIENNKVKIGELFRTNIPSSSSYNSYAISFEDMFFVPIQNNLWRIKDGSITKVWDKGYCRDMAKINDTIWTISNNGQFIFSVDKGQTFQVKNIQEFTNADYSNIVFKNNYLFYNGHYYSNFQDKKAFPLLLGQKVGAFSYFRNGYMYVINGTNYKAHEGNFVFPRLLEIWRHPL